jgi:hypothetical protein
MILQWAVIPRKEVRTTEDLMEQLSNVNKENSVCQVFIPGKGKFAIVLQEEDYRSSAAPVRKEGRPISAAELMRNPFF